MCAWQQYRSTKAKSHHRGQLFKPRIKVGHVLCHDLEVILKL